MANPEQHGAVVLTLSATGLAVARSLAPRGVRVWGSDPVRTEVGHFSRWIERDRRIAFVPPGPRLLEGLVALAREQARPPVLYPAGDPSIDFVVRHHAALREHFVFPDSLTPECAARLVDKRSFYARCQELGVALPVTFFPDDEAAARRAARELRYPAIVKPAHGHRFRRLLRGAKVAEVGDPETALAWWRRFREWGGEVVLQEVVPGPERQIFVAGLYADAHRTVRALFTACKARQYPPLFGSGSYMEARWQPEIAELSRELVRGLDYTGLCGTEYKWDPRDGRFKLIELNPRPTLWFSLPRAAGVDLVWAAHRDLCGEPPELSIGTQRDGVRWQLLARDLLSAAWFLRRGELSMRELLRTALDPRNKDDGILAGSDPGTIVGMVADLVAKYLSHIRGGGGSPGDPPARETP